MTNTASSIVKAIQDNKNYIDLVRFGEVTFLIKDGMVVEVRPGPIIRIEPKKTK